VTPKLQVQSHTVLDFFERHKPVIAQFSSHGTKNAEILLLDDYDDPVTLDEKATLRLFETVEGVRLVVFNVCHSLRHAEAVASVIDCTIGMADEFGDEAAIKFSSQLYKGIADNKSVAEAFFLGCHAGGSDSPIL